MAYVGSTINPSHICRNDLRDGSQLRCKSSSSSGGALSRTTMTAIVLATANLVSLDVALATSDPSSIKIGGRSADRLGRRRQGVKGDAGVQRDAG